MLGNLPRFNRKFSFKFLLFLEDKILPFGLFLFLSGLLWLPSRGSYISQLSLWFVLPGFFILMVKLFEWRVMIGKFYKIPFVCISVLLFLSWYTVSANWSDGDVSVYDLLKRSLTIVILLFSVAYLMYKKSEKTKSIVDVCSYLVAFSALIGIVNVLAFNDLDFYYRSFRLSNIGLEGFADFRNPIPAGIFYGTFCVWLFSRLSFEKKTVQICLMMLSVLLLQTYIFFTYSRTVWVAILVTYGLIVLFRRSKRVFLNLSLLILHIALLFSLVSINFIKNENVVSLNNKVSKSENIELKDEALDKELIYNNIKYEKERGLTHRDEIWEDTIKKIIKNPILGYGADSSFSAPFDNSSAIAPHAHNLYLQYLYDVGIIGFLAWLSIIISCLYIILKYRKDSDVIQIGALFAFALIVFLADVENIVLGPKQYWILVWLPIGLLIGRYMRIKIKNYTI